MQSPRYAQLTAEAPPSLPVTMLGDVTSEHDSANLEKPLALALLEGGMAVPAAGASAYDLNAPRGFALSLWEVLTAAAEHGYRVDPVMEGQYRSKSSPADF